MSLFQGRGEKGNIFVFSSGNVDEDDFQSKKYFHNSNMEFYANSIYTITISSVGIGGVTPEYVKPGACILAATLGDVRTLDDNIPNLVLVFNILYHVINKHSLYI